MHQTFNKISLETEQNCNDGYSRLVNKPENQLCRSRILYVHFTKVPYLPFCDFGSNKGLFFLISESLIWSFHCKTWLQTLTRGKTLIMELNSTLQLDNPESSIVVNPFSVEKVSFLTQDMSIDGQLQSFLSKGFGYWHSVVGNTFLSQTAEAFVPTNPMMIKFWHDPSVVANFPNLSAIACHVSFVNFGFLHF